MQHKLRIFEGPKAVEDDVELVDENQTIEGDETDSDGGKFPHPRKNGCYLRCEQPMECLKDIPRKDRHGQRGRERVEHLDRGVRFER